MDDFATLIRTARERMPATQQALSRKTGIAQGTLSRLETGTYKDIPGPEIIGPLSDALGISQAELLEAIGYTVNSERSPLPANPREQLAERVRGARLNDDRLSTLNALLDQWKLNDSRS